ncbi:MAG: hypothetical protein IT361_03660 [Gemmatimonadaceae bacterium]|nr:hypothetical protein [Gemmatimonadaceae bacterium]
MPRTAEGFFAVPVPCAAAAEAPASDAAATEAPIAKKARRLGRASWSSASASDAAPMASVEVTLIVLPVRVR